MMFTQLSLLFSPKLKKLLRLESLGLLTYVMSFTKLQQNYLLIGLNLFLSHIFLPTKVSLFPIDFDNIIIGYDNLHSMITKCKGIIIFMGPKLDMSKAYDKIEQKILESMLVKMGFNNRWIGLIMASMSSVSYSIMVNGQSQPSFQPTRGLMQGILFFPNCSFFVLKAYLIS